MSIVEDALRNARSRTVYDEVEENKAERISRTRRFLAGEISGREYRDLAAGRPIEASVILNFPGPLYGLLRRLGLNQDMAREAADHEKAHYWAAKRRGPNPCFNVIYSRVRGGFSKAERPSYRMHLFVSFDLPGGTDRDMRDALLETILAPEDPSPDDLAMTRGASST